MMTASVGLVMLSSPQWIVITRRKVLLEVLLNVVICSHLFEEIDHPQCVIAPICRLGHWQIVNAAHFVEVDKGVCVPDDCQAGLNIKSRLETDPGIDATLVETLEGLDPVPRQGRRTLPLQGKV